jgi:protoporphyrinogen oxidase
MRMPEGHDVVILGAGIAGLAAASVLGRRAVVVEQSPRPGGLARTEHRNGYWFDHVLHVLYFDDPATEGRLRRITAAHLSPCTPEAWVECLAGTARYPFQMHLADLDHEVVIRCLRDLAEVSFRPAPSPPADFAEWLLRTFGRGLCEQFLLPYNRKLWRRPLASLAPAGSQWTIARPDFERVLLGALSHTVPFEPYNARAFYPRPAPGASLRGMEVLTHALALQATQLLLDHRVEALDLNTRTVTARCRGRRVQLRFREACLATIPLPELVRMCPQVPAGLRAACGALLRNRVLTAAFSIRGPRPQGRGHWRYYADESLAFTRLIHMHEFDPFTAPQDGWGLMAEIVQPAETPLDSRAAILARALRDIRRARALPGACEVVDQDLIVVDPAYVVFTAKSRGIVSAAIRFLQAHGVLLLGRYGRWEYSSMAQVARDGFSAAETILAGEGVGKHTLTARPLSGENGPQCGVAS